MKIHLVTSLETLKWHFSAKNTCRTPSKTVHLVTGDMEEKDNQYAGRGNYEMRFKLNF